MGIQKPVLMNHIHLISPFSSEQVFTHLANFSDSLDALSIEFDYI
jgi:hypothetical protein